ncbi:hypothetical protein ACSX1A_05730 [Pontibacter sp. MBLB2868]|uniref:hypothetical protein n=1 Tax=Pontibacter sp. MBLB2868 TaxID=3451555 RepID=UPI003F7506E2
MANNDENKSIVEKDYEILKTRIKELSFIHGVSIYIDDTATKRRVEAGYSSKFENNMSVVTEDGSFLFDKIFMRMDRFYHTVTINSYGLFEFTSKKYNGRYELRNEIAFYKYISDYEGNFLSENEFNKLLEILSNRTMCFKPEDFIKMDAYILNGSFEIPSIKTGIYGIKEKSYDFDLHPLSMSGLNVVSEEHRRPLSDSTTTSSYVEDSSGNKLSLHTFYFGMLMLNNGNLYRNSLLNQYPFASTSL